MTICGPHEQLVFDPLERKQLGVRPAPNRLAEFARGRSAARSALAQLQAPWAKRCLLANAKRTPNWPKGVVGSISHSQGWAVAAVSQNTHLQGLGIDLERLRRPSAALAKRLFTPQERYLWERCPIAQRPVYFTACFSAKESVYKAIHLLLGRFLGFQDVEISLEESFPGLLSPAPQSPVPQSPAPQASEYNSCNSSCSSIPHYTPGDSPGSEVSFTAEGRWYWRVLPGAGKSAQRATYAHGRGWLRTAAPWMLTLSWYEGEVQATPADKGSREACMG